MNNKRIAKLEGMKEDKIRVCKPKMSWLPTALKRCGLNLGEAIETANDRSDWKRLRQLVEAYVTPIRQKG